MLFMILACGEAEEPAATPQAQATEAVEKAPLSPPRQPELERSPPLQALVATSGNGADRMFDNDTKTGWSPEGESRSEGVLMRLGAEHDKGVEGMEVVLCPDSARAALQLYANGTLVGNLRLGPGEGDEARFEPFSTRSLFIKINEAEGPVCIAEVGLIIEGEGHIPEPPRAVLGQLSVSSQLDPEDAYHPDYLFDSRMDFGWVEGDAGSGEGQFITVDFERSQTLIGLQLWNGYQRSADHFAKNARIKSLKVSADGQPVGASLGVADEQGRQVLSFEAPVSARQLKLEVAEVYPGSKYKDLVVSELRFVDAEGAFGLVVDEGSRSRALKKEIAGSALESTVDQSWRSVCDGPYIGSRELKLRSNHSFVWYDESEDLNEVFDGAWVPKDEGVQLYGRIHRIQTVYVAYGQGQTSDTTRIGGGKVSVTRAADLDQASWDERIDQLSKGAANLRVECAPTHEEAVKRGLILVEGKPFVDLLEKR